MNTIPRPPVGADDAMEHPTPAPCRGRLIVPIADLSALAASPQSTSHPDVPIIAYNE